MYVSPAREAKTCEVPDDGRETVGKSKEVYLASRWQAGRQDMRPKEGTRRTKEECPNVVLLLEERYIDNTPCFHRVSNPFLAKGETASEGEPKA